MLDADLHLPLFEIESVRHAFHGYLLLRCVAHGFNVIAIGID